MSTLRVNQVYLNDAGNATVSIANSWNVAIIAGGQTRMVTTSNGMVGIGTTDPGVFNSRFTVYQPTYGITAATFQGPNGLIMADYLGTGSNYFEGSAAIFTNYGASVEYMRVAATGNVGIGTSTPGYKLDVAGTINTANLLVNGVVPVSVPTGAVINYASTTAPTGGYLACDGSIYTRSAYGTLANVIGTPPMLSSYTAEYSNSNAQWVSGQIAVANGVAFITNANPVITSVNPQGQYSGGLYTSTDGSTWTPRTARSFYFNSFIINGAVAANASGGVWMLANTPAPAIGQYSTSYPQTTNFAALNYFQTSTDLTTWTNRTITMTATQTGMPTAPAATMILSGIAGGGTSNRIVALFTKWAQGCCLTTTPYIANTATTDDAGVTWSFTNNIPVSNSNYYSAIASSNGGFVITRGNTAYWSYSGQTWQDISANLTVALGMSATSNVVAAGTLLFYSVYQANNQFIIPAYGNKFLVSSASGNGANGNWSTVGPVEGLPYYDGTFINTTGSTLVPGLSQFLYLQYPSSNGYGMQRIVHNGQCFVLNYSGQIYYSQDLKYWFRKHDMNYSQYGNGGNLAALGNKFLLNIYSNKTIVSFTANGAYTAATQFPVPRYSQVSSWSHSIEGGPAEPLISYIKT